MAASFLLKYLVWLLELSIFCYLVVTPILICGLRALKYYMLHWWTRNLK
jgi:hypothetical protein